MINHFGLAILTFTITNIDDLLILSIYFASGQYKTKTIVAGQYLGIITLILVSLAGIVAGQLLDDHWVSLLGILPFLLGVKGLLSAKKENEPNDEPQLRKNGLQFLSVALVTIANGGDNIGVYAPLFANIPQHYIYLYILMFLLLTALWCFLGYWIVKHPRIKIMFARYGKLILPIFLIILGLFILKDFFIWIIGS